MGYKVAGKETGKGRGRCGRQQTGAGRLGRDELRWHLSTSGACTSLALKSLQWRLVG